MTRVVQGSVQQTSLQFDPPDFAGWLWLALMVLVAGELLRFVLRGRWPAGAARRGALRARAVLALAIVTGAGGLWALGLLRPSAWSHAWACLGLGLFASLWLVRTYQQPRVDDPDRASDELPRGFLHAGGGIGRRLLLSLRVAAAVLLAAALARPAVESAQVVLDRAVVGVVLDDSRSMEIRDVPDGFAPSPGQTLSRLEAVAQVLEKHQAALSQLGEAVELRWFTFDSRVREHPSPTLAGTGGQTALLDAAVEVQRLLALSDRYVAGLVVVSDGRDNASRLSEAASVGDQLLAAGVPFYGVGVGSEESDQEIPALHPGRLDVPVQASIGNRLAVRAELVASGLSGRTVEVELLFDEEVVDRREAPLTGAGRELLRVNLSHVPRDAGLHRVTVQAAVEADEVEPVSMSQTVMVSDDLLQVLYVDRPRYERAAIGRALESAREVRVTRMDPAPTEGAGRAVPPGRAVDVSGVNWADYDVVLIGDVEAGSFSRGDLETVRDLVVEKGRGLALLGGVRTLGSGRYRRTALQGVVPADLSAVGHWPAPLDLVLTPAGRVHPVLQVQAGDPPLAGLSSPWEGLPPLAGASRLGRAPPAAEILMETQGGEPLLVVQEVGQGRAAAVAFDSSWQWPFAEAAEGGGPGGLEIQRRFWRQLVLWLGDRRPRVWVSTDRPRYELRGLLAGTEQVVLRAGADDAFGEQRQDLVFSGRILGPDGRPRPVEWVRTPDGLEASFIPREEGEYLAEVTASDADGVQPPVRAETAFTVELVDLELVNTAADLGALKTIADRTAPVGGAYFPLHEFGRLVDELQAARHQNEQVAMHRVRLVEDYPWIWFFVFVGLISLEWVLRRRRNLV